MTLLNRTIKAELFAKEAHKEQFRKGGEPFINHARRVVNTLSNLPDWALGRGRQADVNRYVAMTIGWLHDVVEDTEFRLEDIEVTFGKDISTRVDYLTRRKNEDYFEYGQRLLSCKDRVIFEVKLADLEDNLGAVGDGAFSKEVENKLQMRWEWLRFKILKELEVMKRR